MLGVLAMGMVGTDVADLQAALNYHLPPPAPPHTPPGPDRPPLKVDGIFGVKTDARLREFQRLNHLTVDGKAGPITMPLFTKAKLVTVRIPITPQDETPDEPNAASFLPVGGGGANALVGTQGQFAQAAPGGPSVGQSKPLIAPLQLQNVQVQTGGNLTLKPLLGPGKQNQAAFLAVQFTWVERRDGRHLELAVGTQFAAPLTRNMFGLSSSSAQTFAQASVADLLTINKANLHIFSPSAQVSFQRNHERSLFKSISVGVSIQNQIAWDFVKKGDNPIFSLFCQQQLGWTYDFTDRKGAIAPSFLVGATWQTNLF
jgi:Putative peptidoglycan binding domain